MAIRVYSVKLSARWILSIQDREGGLLGSSRK